MDEQNEQQQEKLTRSELKKQTSKHHFGGKKLHHFKAELDQDLSDQPSVGTRSERDTVEFKQKRLGRRLNIAIGILVGLLILVLLIMRFVG